MAKTNKLPKTLDDLNVRYFKLMSGDSIVSYVHDLDPEDHGAVVGLEEPMTVSIDPEDHSYMLTPWMPFSKGIVHLLDTYNVIIESDVDTEIKATYMKIVLDSLEPDYDDHDGTVH
jgi:hypothetical protein